MKKPIPGGAHCRDCGEMRQYYTVKDHVWAQAVPEYQRVKKSLAKAYRGGEYTWFSLCLHCLQRRLGRMLTTEDFDFSIPSNGVMSFTIQMLRYQQAAEECEPCRTS